jgi:hypothetical protein
VNIYKYIDTTIRILLNIVEIFYRRKNMNNKRIYAEIVDFLITCVIQTVLMVLFFIKPLLNNTGDINTFNIMVRMFTISYCSMMYLVIRDIIGKKSIEKEYSNYGENDIL